jgi:hypothetical protein
VRLARPLWGPLASVSGVLWWRSSNLFPDNPMQRSPRRNPSELCQLGYLPSVYSSPAVGLGHKGG